MTGLKTGLNGSIVTLPRLHEEDMELIPLMTEAALRHYLVDYKEPWVIAEERPRGHFILELGNLPTDLIGLTVHPDSFKAQLTTHLSYRGSRVLLAILRDPGRFLAEVG